MLLLFSFLNELLRDSKALKKLIRFAGLAKNISSQPIWKAMRHKKK